LFSGIDSQPVLFVLTLYNFLTASIVREIKPAPKTIAAAATAVAREGNRSICDSFRYAEPREISPRPPAMIAKPDRAWQHKRNNGDVSINQPSICGLTMNFSSRAGCKDSIPRKAVMPAPAAETAG
jgi:hypothetical protein